MPTPVYEFHQMEESLKSYLIDAQSDRYHSRNANLYKYNNLKIYMDPKQNKTPHVIIRIGISEAMYKIANGEKLTGGLGSDERYVRMWIDRYLLKMDLATVWSKNNKVKTVIIKKNADDYEDNVE